jgi:hypothetical protein
LYPSCGWVWMCCCVGVGGNSFDRLCYCVGGCSFGRASRDFGKIKIQLKIPIDVLFIVLILILFFNLNYVKFWPLYPSLEHTNDLAIGLGPRGQVTLHWTVTWPRGGKLCVQVVGVLTAWPQCWPLRPSHSLMDCDLASGAQPCGNTIHS